MLKLEFKDRRQPGVWLVESVFTIGSGTKNHLVIDDDSVGEAHAEIRLVDGQLYLNDLGSFKGTFVGGQKVIENFQLRSGDIISIGRVELEISDPKTRPTTVGAAKAKSDWSLTAIGGDMQGRTIMIHGSMTFGRSSNCDIIIEGEYMSRRHAELSLKGGGLRIVDLGSSNGTCVNGKKVNEHQLKPGDKISFDKAVFLVAGPVGEVAAASFLEDEEEATMFRAVAPMPKSPPPKVQSSVSAPIQQVEDSVSAASDSAKSGKGGMIAVGLVVVVVVVAAMGYMATVGG